jgi:gliding motility-associated-like protein
MKKQIANIALIILLIVGKSTFGQISISRQVIGSTGGFSTGTTMTLSSTVGEAVVQSIFSVNIILTQGFQQPQKSIEVVSSDSTIWAEVINATCVSGGSIYIDSVTNCSSSGGYFVTITMVNDSIELSPDSLTSGFYNVTVSGDMCSSSTIIEVGFDGGTNCELKFYSGITPNGDSNNDIWFIDNIEFYPENTVQIFNRWGNEVWFGKGYDNNNVVWSGLDKSGVQLTDGTYFYVVATNGNTNRGWIELTR